MKNVEDIYRLSPMQAGMLFHCLAAPGDDVYVEQYLARLDGELAVEPLQAAWDKVVARHAVLRTVFVWEGLHEPMEVVRRQVTLPWERLDWSDRSADEQDRRFDELLQSDRARAFVLTRAPLMRMTLVRLAADRHALLWTFHHLLLDGWSCAIVQQEVVEEYLAGQAGLPLLVPPARPFAEYVRWLGEQESSGAEQFWRARLAGVAPTPLRFESPAQPPVGGGALAQVDHLWPEDHSARIAAAARRQGLALNTVCQAAWALVLAHYAGSDDVLFGATVAGRPATLPDVDRMVGLFINTLCVRVTLPRRRRVGEWLAQLQLESAQTRQYEQTPLAAVQRWSGAAAGPLFETLLVYESYPRPRAAAAMPIEVPLRVTPLRTVEKTNYPLTLLVHPGDRIEASLVFHRRRFAAAAMTRVLQQFAAAVDAVLDDPMRELRDLSLLSERERLAGGGHRETLPAVRPALLLQRLHEQAAARPHAIAVVCGTEAVSYLTLHRRANRMAHRLRAAGVGAEVCVAVGIERTIDLLVALLAVWKAGGTYVPLDPHAPAARQAFIVADACAPIVVTSRALQAQMPDAATVMYVDDEGPADLPDDPPPSGVEAANLAYVIYTSGSTGEPKGVGVTHGNVASLFAATEALFACSADDTWTLFHSAGFDFSVWEMWGALVYGGRLVVVPRETTRTPAAFASLLRDEGVTVLNQTPSAFRALQSVDTSGVAPRVVIFGGEALAFDSLSPWVSLHGLARPQLVNMYGITETTVHVTHHIVSAGEVEAPAGSEIGEPLPGWQIYLLDREQRPVPDGMPGEIYVGGAGVARGYLGRPELTAARFVPDPHSAVPGARMYRSGDVARRRVDGGCEFLGRADQQVKVRGHRIEPGEIEAAIRGQAGVRDAVVLLREDVPGDPRLVAYVVEHSRGAVEPDDLRRGLRTVLPDYMVPAAVITLESLPLTVNGKVDRRALPVPGIARLATGSYVPPRDELELQLVRAWEQLLHAHPIGMRDEFFEVGGHSLLLLQLVAHIERTFEIRIPLADLVQGTTIERLALMIRQRRSGSDSRLVVLQPNGSGMPVFAMVPAGGTLACYVPLSEVLPAERPFHALQPRSTLEEAAAAPTIELMAQADLEELRRVQPSGPYSLVGWSMGGLVAYEMACLLRDAGEQVEMLALLDVGVPDPTQQEADVTELLLGLAVQHLGLDLAQLGDVEGEARIEAALEIAQREGKLADEVDMRWVRWLAEGFRLGVTSTRQYRPRPFDGRVILIRASEHDAGTDETMGWGALAAGGVRVHWVSGAHHNMVHHPHVAVVAEALQPYLAGEPAVSSAAVV